MFVIAQDLVWRPRIEIRQGRATLADFHDFGSEGTTRLAAPDSEQALFRRPTDRCRDGFSRECRKLPYRFFRRGVFDTKRDG
jgi:hypothetical protein